MKSSTWVLLAIGLVALLWGTVMVFAALDKNSHSVSDTVRPFVITMAPVWAVAIAGAAAVLRRPEK